MTAQTRTHSLPRLVALAALVLAAFPLFLASHAEGALPATVSVRSSSYGPVLFDGRGYALYAFTRDPRNRSTCFGACATAWPPYRARGALRAGSGARAALLGRTRSGQVTYAGRPLYYYIGDRRPRQILCQDVFEFGGRWL
ncbi:MAG: COG4315 family predicted lipoprotein, partial [Gaiellaceae bacterium]